MLDGTAPFVHFPLYHPADRPVRRRDALVRSLGCAQVSEDSHYTINLYYKVSLRHVVQCVFSEAMVLGCNNFLQKSWNCIHNELFVILGPGASLGSIVLEPINCGEYVCPAVQRREEYF